MRLAHKVQQVLKFSLGFTREAGDEGGPHHQLGAGGTPGQQPVQIALTTGRAFHAAQHIGVAVLERHVQVRQHAASGHDGQQLIHMRVGVDVMQPHPGAVGGGQLGQLRTQLGHAGLDRSTVKKAGAVLHIHAVSAGVLADHQQLFDTVLKQCPRLGQHITHGARHQITPHAGDDAKRAAVVAAFTDLEVSVVARRQLDASLTTELGTLLRHQINKRVVRLGHMQMHCVHHLLRGMRASDGQHAGVHLPHQVAALTAGAGTQAAGDDDLAVGGQRLANGVQAFAHRVIDKTAGVDDHQVSAGKGFAGLVTLSTELGEDQFAVGQRLGAAQADKADFGCGLAGQAGGEGGFLHAAIVGDKLRQAASALGPQRLGVSPGMPGNSLPAAICSCIWANSDLLWSR